MWIDLEAWIVNWCSAAFQKMSINIQNKTYNVWTVHVKSNDAGNVQGWLPVRPYEVLDPRSCHALALARMQLL